MTCEYQERIRYRQISPGFFSLPEIPGRVIMAICQWITPEIFLIVYKRQQPRVGQGSCKKKAFFCDRYDLYQQEMTYYALQIIRWEELVGKIQVRDR